MQLGVCVGQLLSDQRQAEHRVRRDPAARLGGGARDQHRFRLLAPVPVDVTGIQAGELCPVEVPGRGLPKLVAGAAGADDRAAARRLGDDHLMAGAQQQRARRDRIQGDGAADDDERAQRRHRPELQLLPGEQHGHHLDDGLVEVEDLFGGVAFLRVAVHAQVIGNERGRGQRTGDARRRFGFQCPTAQRQRRVLAVARPGGHYADLRKVR